MPCAPDRAMTKAVSALIARIEVIEKRLEALEKPAKPPKDKETK